MRVLFDECLPRRLKRDLVGHDVRTAPEMGWASKRNGELLALAVGQFEVFLTADRISRTNRIFPPSISPSLCSLHAATALTICVLSCRSFFRHFRRRGVAP